MYMESILNNRPALAAEVEKVAETAGYLWQKGWAERNGGNITINITEYVDDAIMLGMPSVRIIHGKGTGVLREEIQKFLRTMPGVASVSDEHIQFGGTGVTIVTFD